MEIKIRPVVIDDYDLIFIDCPPSLELLTVNAIISKNDLYDEALQILTLFIQNFSKYSKFNCFKKLLFLSIHKLYTKIFK